MQPKEEIKLKIKKDYLLPKKLTLKKEKRILKLGSKESKPYKMKQILKVLLKKIISENKKN